ncbi:50S ribosomal protein L3 [Clostridia bacterium]|nr:50S ribosomal protein L3 [Clostridia bacterium]
MKAILAKKVGMTQVFGDNGTLIPVTVLEAGPIVVTQKKTVATDGYNAIQVGFGEVKEKRLNKPDKGRFDKVNVPYKKLVKEFKVENPDDYELGAVIDASIFANGEKVDVSGLSKGKGYQGAIKRWGQHRGPMTHGSKYHRHAGAMSGATDPGKVKKGKRLPGHMGHVRITVQNLTIVRADGEKNLILLKGAVPGAKGTVLTIKQTVKIVKSKKA